MAIAPSGPKAKSLQLWGDKLCRLLQPQLSHCHMVEALIPAGYCLLQLYSAIIIVSLQGQFGVLL